MATGTRTLVVEDGSLVVWRIRRDYGKEVPVAVVTGQTDPQFQSHLVREPPDALFKKPLDFGALVNWLKSVT
jgi:hypothetical protein